MERLVKRSPHWWPWGVLSLATRRCLTPLSRSFMLIWSEPELAKGLSRHGPRPFLLGRRGLSTLPAS